MNENFKNFFLEKNYKVTTKTEYTNTRISLLVLCLIQFIVINYLADIPIAELRSIYVKFSNVILILGISIFVLSLLNNFFNSIFKSLLYLTATFIFVTNLGLISFYKFDQKEIVAINWTVIIFLIISLKKSSAVFNVIFIYSLLYTIAFLLTPNTNIGNLILFLLANVLFYFLQTRFIFQQKYLDSLQNYLSSITNSGKDFYFLIDKNFRIRACNTYAIVFWGEGYLRNLDGQSINKFIAPEFKNLFKTDVERLFNYSGEIEREIELVDNKNNAFWVIIKMSVLKIYGQTFISFAAKNIAEIKKTESHLRDTMDILAEQKADMELNQKAMVNMLEDIDIQKRIAKRGEEETKTILENIADAVVVLDDHKKITIANKAAIKLTKYTEEELVNHSYSSRIKIFLEKKDTPYTDYLDKTYKGEIVVSENKYYITTKDGERIDVSISSAPSVDKNNKVEKCIIVIKDVTKAKQIEKMKDEFVSIASHQLRTPLTTIKWHTEILEDMQKQLPTDIAPSITFISEASERLIHLVTELLDVSRIDTGRNFQIEKQEHDLLPIINNILIETKILADNKKLKVNFVTDKKKNYSLLVDDFKITEAITNILTNAIKYSKEDKEIEIKLYKDKEFVSVEIADQGVGIPESEQSRIFERFYRAKNAMYNEGTGLGLYITKSIIEAHEGQLTFNSKEGVGTTFIIKLPIK